MSPLIGYAVYHVGSRRHTHAGNPAGTQQTEFMFIHLDVYITTIKKRIHEWGWAGIGRIERNQGLRNDVIIF